MLDYAMPKWKDIAKLSDREEQTREAAFEAEMLASPGCGQAQTVRNHHRAQANNRAPRRHPDQRH